MNTVPNQRTVIVHRERAAADFLGIKNENWQRAARDLGAHALLLYLYLAANKDDYRLALSPAAIRAAVGMPPQTQRDQFLKLLDKGYLVQKGSNSYDFYEIPKPAARSENSPNSCSSDGDFPPPVVHENTNAVTFTPSESREININIINNKNNGQKKQVSSAKKDGFIF